MEMCQGMESQNLLKKSKKVGVFSFMVTEIRKGQAMDNLHTVDYFLYTPK